MHRGHILSLLSLTLVAAGCPGPADSLSTAGAGDASTSGGPALADSGPGSPDAGAGIADAGFVVADAGADAGAPPPTGASSLELIDAAETSGAISAQTALAYRVFATFNDPRLPAAYRGNNAGRFGVGIVRTLREDFETLSPSTQAVLEAYLLPPAYEADSAPPATSRTALQVRPTCRVKDDWTFAVGSPTPRVRVWYERSADKSNAEALALALETEIWPVLIDSLGMEPPIPDTYEMCNGGSGALDVYLTYMGVFSDFADYGGVTLKSGGDCRKAPVYIMLDRSVTGDKLKAAVAHEFMHAIQWAYESKSCKGRYGWMLDATADWAIDQVYPGNDLEHEHAPWYMDSPEKSLDDRIRKDGSEGRDYGAYLFFQFLAHTVGPDAVRATWQATVDLPTSLEAVNGSIPGGFAKQWPEFAKRLFNQDPIDLRKDSFNHWDSLAEQAAFALETTADLEGAPEGKIELDDEMTNLSVRYYRFQLLDPNTRSLLFHNGFFPEHESGKAISVYAFWKDSAGRWNEEDWSSYEFVGLCRDVSNQRASEIVVVISNGEFAASGGGKITASSKPYLKRSNVGCWKYEGDVTALRKYPSWVGMGKRVQSHLVFELDPRATDLQVQHPSFANTLRVGLTMAIAMSGRDCTVDLSYSTFCSFSAGPVQFSLLPNTGVLMMNPFPELKATDPYVKKWLAEPARTYSVAAGDVHEFNVTVGGPSSCSGRETDVVGNVLLTEATGNGVMLSPPIAKPNGDLSGHFVLNNITFDWNLKAQSQP